ncbi:hypothetical protein BKA83DRAFT_2024403 [Pisolithus microcarpus]|nr:hypothetical protein BKA83DRAFT_2024403 [Pisolithus microcarpus]
MHTLIDGRILIYCSLVLFPIFYSKECRRRLADTYVVAEVRKGILYTLKTENTRHNFKPCRLRSSDDTQSPLKMFLMLKHRRILGSKRYIHGWTVRAKPTSYRRNYGDVQYLVISLLTDTESFHPNTSPWRIRRNRCSHDLSWTLLCRSFAVSSCYDGSVYLPFKWQALKVHLETRSRSTASFTTACLGPCNCNFLTNLGTTRMS